MDTKNSFTRVFTVVAIAVAVAIFGGIAYCAECIEPLKVRTDLLSRIPDVLTKYLMIVIAIERSAFIFVNIFRRKDENTWLRRIERVQPAVDGKDVTQPDGSVENRVNPTFVMNLYEKENKVLQTINDETIIAPKFQDSDQDGEVSVEEARGYLGAILQIYKFQLGAYQMVTSRYASYIVFGSGLMLATFGISMLDDLVYLPNMDACNLLQCYGIRGFDVLFTGGLIGGGSASFNKLINTIQAAIPTKSTSSI